MTEALPAGWKVAGDPEPVPWERLFLLAAAGAGPRLFLRCPQCGALVGEADKDLHERSHAPLLQRSQQPAGGDLDRLRDEIASALDNMGPGQIVSPGVTVIGGNLQQAPDAATLREFLRENATIVKPGETLVIRAPDLTPNQMRELYESLNWRYDDGTSFLPFRVLIVPGDELGVAEAGS